MYPFTKNSPEKWHSAKKNWLKNSHQFPRNTKRSQRGPLRIRQKVFLPENLEKPEIVKKNSDFIKIYRQIALCRKDLRWPSILANVLFLLKIEAA